MDNIISDIKTTLKTIENDISAIQETKPDTFALQQLELLRQRLQLDLRQVETIKLQSHSVSSKYQETAQSLKEIKHG